MSSPGKRKRAQPPSKVVLSEGSGDEAPIPSSSFWSSRQQAPLFLPSSSDEDLARRRRNFEIADYAQVLRLVPVDPLDPNPPIVRPPYVPPLPLPREAWPSVALPPPLPSVASSSVAGSSRAGRARRPSLGTQLHEQQFYGTPATSLPPPSPAVPVARDGPRRLDLSQLSARPRRRVPRSGPMGIAQNFPRPAETPRSPSPSGRYTPPTDSLSVLGAVSPQPPVVRLPPRSLAEIARAPTSPIPSLRSSPRDSGTPPPRAPLGWRARPDRVIGMEAPPFDPEASRASPTPAPALESPAKGRKTKPFYVLVPPPRDYRVVGTKVQPSPRKPQLATMAVTPWHPVETPPPGPRSRSSSFSEPPVDIRPPSVPVESRSESAHDSFVTAASPVADAEPRVATPVASPPPIQSEAAFRRGLIREANRLEREQLQRDLAEVDRIIRLREVNPPASLAPAREEEDTPPPAKKRRIHKRASPPPVVEDDTRSFSLDRSPTPQPEAPSPAPATLAPAVAISSQTPVHVTRSTARAAGSTQTPAVAVNPIAARTPSVDRPTPVKRGPGRPPGAKNKKGAKGKGKGKGTQPLRDHIVVGPNTVMAGPLPVAGESSGRSGPFNFPMPVPPINVDGLERVFTHDVLQPFFGGCDFCLVHDYRCDVALPGLACSSCLTRRWPCPNLNSVHQRMGFFNRLAQRFENLGNDHINNIVYQMNHHGDNAMAALELARSSQREYVRYQRLLGDVMTQMTHAYGDASGVAHAAEISAEQIEQFAEYWTAGRLSLPPRPPPASSTSRLRGAPPSRRTWAREPFEYYAGLDARNDPEIPVPTSNAPGGDPGQSSSRRDVRDRSNDEDGEQEWEDDRGPPSPSAPHGS
ncbi:hypothetical protein GGX14DRAFT_559963 [Mycena pura]|uniref:Uncharacterized protein n=1 Tax=Mycena pura TaxID=153505 RepID=A0AAD6VUF9_9AGAR|nr:hypothetical protein GGX14DRAFT_559963 [Mycena pura]